MKAERGSLLGSLLFAVFVLGGVSGCGDDVETPVSPGDPVWARRFGRASSPEATAIAGFPTGGVVVAGRYYGDLSFGGSVLPSPSNNYQVLLARYDAEGNHIARVLARRRRNGRVMSLCLPTDPLLSSAILVGRLILERGSF